MSEAYSNRASAHLLRKENQQAIADCDAAIRLTPKSASAFTIRGWALNTTERYEEAVADFTKAIQLNPRQAIAAYDGRATAYRALDRPEAVDDLRKRDELKEGGS